MYEDDSIALLFQERSVENENKLLFTIDKFLPISKLKPNNLHVNLLTTSIYFCIYK